MEAKAACSLGCGRTFSVRRMGKYRWHEGKVIVSLNVGVSSN